MRLANSERLADENNQPVLIDDTPAYQFTSGDARILGGEASIDIHPVEHLHIGNTFSYVNSVQLHQPSESKYLPFTPAPRWVSDVRYEFVCDGKTFDHLFVKLQMDCNLRQNHYFAANDTETATPSYTLLNMYAGYRQKRRLQYGPQLQHKDSGSYRAVTPLYRISNSPFRISNSSSGIRILNKQVPIRMPKAAGKATFGVIIGIFSSNY